MNVPLAGERAPVADQIEDLIRVLVTIHHRFGNTAVRYRLAWGSRALWVEDEQKQRIAELEAALEECVRLQRHYAHLLNMHDGGQRHEFANAEEWLARLKALATQRKEILNHGDQPGTA